MCKQHLYVKEPHVARGPQFVHPSEHRHFVINYNKKSLREKVQ